MRRDVFRGIADPTRRQIVNLVVQGALTPNAVSENFDVSRQAIAKHLHILTECGLIIVKQNGRQRHYEAKLGSLNAVTGWIKQQRRLWAGRFDRIDELLAAEKKTSARQK